jgi:hypothetical protein
MGNGLTAEAILQLARSPRLPSLTHIENDFRQPQCRRAPWGPAMISCLGGLKRGAVAAGLIFQAETRRGPPGPRPPASCRRANLRHVAALPRSRRQGRRSSCAPDSTEQGARRDGQLASEEPGSEPEDRTQTSAKPPNFSSGCSRRRSMHPPMTRAPQSDFPGEPS